MLIYRVKWTVIIAAAAAANTLVAFWLCDLYLMISINLHTLQHTHCHLVIELNYLENVCIAGNKLR